MQERSLGALDSTAASPMSRWGLEAARESRSSPERPTTNLANPDGWLEDAFGVVHSEAGVPVNNGTALRMTAVFACLRVLAETLACLPLIVYERLPDGGKRRAPEHPLYPILHDQPNPNMSSFSFIEAGMVRCASYGNSFAKIERNGAGRVSALWPIDPSTVTVEVSEDNALAYRIERDGVYFPDEILHVLGLGDNGYVGFNPIQMAREGIGLGIAAEKFGARFFGTGAHASGMLTSESVVKPEDSKRVAAAFHEAYGGVGNSHKILVTGGGLKFQPISITNEDAQFLETRKFQVEEIARLFRVPPHAIGDLSHSTFSNIEHQSIDLKTFTMQPWGRRWEAEINRKLFSTRASGSYFVEFNYDALLRGDTASRIAALVAAVGGPFMSGNEARGIENLNKVDGLDDVLRPLNMAPANQPQPAPAAKVAA